MQSWPQSSIFCRGSPPPAWLLQSQSTRGHDFGFQSRCEFGGPQPSNFKSTLGRDFGLPPASIPMKISSEGFYPCSAFGHQCNVDIGVVCEARPLFDKGPNGTFIMNLSGINVKVTTTCSPSPVLFSDLVDFRPHECFHIAFPEMHQVVFDPMSGDSSSLCGSTFASKRFTLLDLTKEHSLNVELNTNAPHGHLTIEDTQIFGHHREVVSEASLHYEVLATGRLYLENSRGSRVHVDLDFEFRYKLECSLCGQVTHDRGSASHVRFQQPELTRPEWSYGSGLSRRQDSIFSDLRSANTFSFCPQPASNCVSGFSESQESTDYETRSSCTRNELFSFCPRPASKSGSGFSESQESTDCETRSSGTRNELFSFCPRPESNSVSGFSESQGSADCETQSSSTRNELLNATVSDEGRSGRGDMMRRQARCFSKVSQEALSQLSNTEDELELIELDVGDIADALQKKAESAEILCMKDALSQLEAKAKALETKGVDGVYTSELTTGKQLAKESKKDMLRRLEELFKQIDDCFAKMRAKRA